MILFTLPAHAAELLLPEQKIKAGLLYNFLKYTQWPREGDSVSVCLYGGDPFGGSLAPMEGRSAGNRIIALREIGSGEGIADCDLLLLKASAHRAWPQLRKALEGKNVLTVSDMQGFVRAGGMVEFTNHDRRIQVRIDPDTVAAAGLTVQDSLLQLTSTVRSDRKISP